MKRAFFHFLIASIATASAFAEDVIVFKNGDVLRGSIQSRDDKTVSFSSSSVGSIKLSTADIAEIRAETPKADEAVDPAATAAQPAAAAEAPAPAPKGKPEEADAAALLDQMANTTPESAAAEIAEEKGAEAPEPTKPAEVQVPTASPKKEVDRWSGQAGMALAMRENSDSNQTGVYKKEEFRTYRIYGNVNWKGEKNNLKWNWTYRYSEDETKKRDDYLNITQKYNRNFKGAYYAEAKTVYQQDYNRNIDSEFLQTAEIGKKWFDSSKFKFSTSIGGGYHQYQRSVPADTAEVSEPKFIFDESLEWKLVNSLTLFEKYTHLGNLDQYHFVFSAGLENKLIAELFLRLEYRLDRDTDTTYDDRGFYDKALLAHLVYKF